MAVSKSVGLTKVRSRLLLLNLTETAFGYVIAIVSCSTLLTSLKNDGTS